MLYYRYDAVGIDVFDRSDIEKHGKQLESRDCLSERFAVLKNAFDDHTKERVDIIVNALPAIAGIAEIAVYHKIKFKLFSHKIKCNGFYICITYVDPHDKMRLYFLETSDFYTVKRIFTEFIDDGKCPDLAAWKCEYID